jgi:hypothetical protein
VREPIPHACDLLLNSRDPRFHVVGKAFRGVPDELDVPQHSILNNVSFREPLLAHIPGKAEDLIAA